MEAGGGITASPVMLKPGVSSSYGRAWMQLGKYFWILLLIGVIYFVVSCIPNIPQWLGQFSIEDMSVPVGWSSIFQFFYLVYSLLITNPIYYGLSYAYLRAVRGDRVGLEDMFAAFHNYWNAVLAALLVTIIVVIGFILIIVPGIIFTCKLAFVPYLVVERKMDVIEAIKASWRLTSGYAWKVFLLFLLGIPICIAGLICLGVGLIVAIMWITLALAALYHAVSSQSAAEPE